MHEVQVDVDDGRTVCFLVDEVGVPYFFEEGFKGHDNSLCDRAFAEEGWG